MIVLNDVLKGKHSVAIGGHIRPDGDCVGSTIGLYLYLTTYYPEIETDLYLEEIPEAFQMMGHRDVPKHEIVEGKVYDLSSVWIVGTKDVLVFRAGVPKCKGNFMCGSPRQ